MGSFYAWLLSFLFVVSLICILAYQLMCLADLEFDHISPYESASRINSVATMEFTAQGVLCILYIFTGHWVMFLICLPYLCYNARLYMRGRHLVDVTEIFNHLSREKKLRLCKLANVLLLLFTSVFWTIWSVLEDY